ncbi:MAG: helix-turn-helix transcriptional regulator [Sterolibacterium sp.]
MDICQVIRSFRESQNLSAEQLALSLGVETSTITRAERGERRLSTDLLERIAAALKIGVTDLYAIVEGREVVPANGSEDQSTEVGEALVVLRRLLLDLNPDQRTLIVELAKTVARHPQG